MATLFHSTIDDPQQWLPVLQAQLPDEDFRLWPDIGEPSEIDVAILWTQPPEGVQALPNLKAIQSLGAGINQLGLETVPPAVRIARLVDDSLSEGMAEYCLLAVLRYFRRWDMHEAAQRAGQWSFCLPQERKAYTIGIMGLGVLGTAVAARLTAHGFNVRGWTRSPRDVAGVPCFSGPDGLEVFLSGLNVLICLLPLTPATTGILDAQLFGKLKGVYLVNVGRGAHLVEEDLIPAMAAGHLAGATLDVFRQEPPPADHSFWSHPQIMMTPHVAAMGDPATAAAIIAENIRRARSGATLVNEVDRGRGY